ncbi:cytochrome P450 [Nocardia sp. NPDC006044]|uniref:cytochrome P450 n=1 Tax=Nocardia sp. NPDC006044 TaxID=3364306 RepID=UPI00368D3532
MIGHFRSSIPTASGGRPLLGHSLRLWRDPWAFLTSLPSQSSTLIRVRLGPLSTVVVCDPALTRQVLRDDRVFDKGGPLFEVARRVVGDNVITVPHDEHRNRRRRIQASFHRTRLPGYARAMSVEIDAITAEWEACRNIEVVPEMLRLTTRCFLAAMFSESLAPSHLDRAVNDVTAIVDGLYLELLTPRWFKWVPTRGNRRYRAAQRSLRRLIDQFIEQRFLWDDDTDGLLATLLAEQHGTANNSLPMNASVLYDQLMAFFIAGSETTASVLSWAIHLLSSHPDILTEVEAEADRVLLHGLAHYEHFAELTLTRRVLAETLRLYPPGWLFTRTVTTDTRLDGHLLPKGTPVMYSPYLLHRLEREFSDAEKFDPDRWKRGEVTRHPMSYLPFGAGPRRCAGEDFALTEAVLTLATIVRRWHLNPPTKTIRPTVAMALHPTQFRIQLTARMAPEVARSTS